MPAVVAKTLEEHVRDAILTDQALIDYFAGLGRDLPSAVFPRALEADNAADVLGIDTEPPFFVVRYGGESGQYVYVGPFTIWIYDAPEERYWRIEELVVMLRRLFNNRKFAPSVAGYTQYQKVRYEYRSQQSTDDDWQKNYEFARFSTWGI